MGNSQSEEASDVVGSGEELEWTIDAAATVIAVGPVEGGGRR